MPGPEQEPHLPLVMDPSIRGVPAARFLHQRLPPDPPISPKDDGPKFDEMDYVLGLENPTEVFAKVHRWLVADSHGDDGIAKAVGLNMLCVLRKAWTR